MTTLLQCPYAFEDPPEPYAPLERVHGCNPIPGPGVQLFRDWTIGMLGGLSLGIVRACSVGAPSKHHEGRAWDWAPPTPAAAEQAWSELTASGDELARRAGLRTMIWNRRIWIAGKVSPYDGASPHTDHVHFGFGWAGARGETSLYRVIVDPSHDRPHAPLDHPATLARLPGLSTTTPAFRRKLVAIAKELSIEPDHLAAVIAFETAGTWSPSAQNARSGATGLLQWTAPSARSAFRLSLAQIATMSGERQLELVAKWMRLVRLPPRSPLRDVYLAVFAPAFVPSRPQDPIYAAPSRSYVMNRELDRDGDATITAEEAASGPRALLSAASDAQRIEIR